jgi:hypothetical protein
MDSADAARTAEGGDVSHVTNREAAGFDAEPEFGVTPRDLAELVEIDTEKLDARYKYRFSHKSPLKVARNRARGYRIVDPGVETIYTRLGEEVIPAADGTYTFGDTVLMRIPRKEHQARRIAQRKKTNQRLSGPKKKFKSKARGLRDRAGNRIEVITDKEPGGSGRRGR